MLFLIAWQCSHSVLLSYSPPPLPGASEEGRGRLQEILKTWPTAIMLIKSELCFYSETQEQLVRAEKVKTDEKISSCSRSWLNFPRILSRPFWWSDVFVNLPMGYGKFNISDGSTRGDWTFKAAQPFSKRKHSRMQNLPEKKSETLQQSTRKKYHFTFDMYG